MRAQMCWEISGETEGRHLRGQTQGIKMRDGAAQVRGYAIILRRQLCDGNGTSVVVSVCLSIRLKD